MVGWYRLDFPRVAAIAGMLVAIFEICDHLENTLLTLGTNGPFPHRGSYFYGARPADKLKTVPQPSLQALFAPNSVVP